MPFLDRDEEKKKGKTLYRRNKKIVEARTGVPMDDGPYDPSERDFIIDTYLAHWPDKPKIHSLLIEALPSRAGYFCSNNNPFEQFVARRKHINPVKRRFRRAGLPWTDGDQEVIDIVCRKKNVEKGMCQPRRVAAICRRKVSEVRNRLVVALQKAHTYDLALEMELVE